MRIVHISTSNGGGAGLASRRINEALNSYGIDSTLIYMKGSMHCKESIERKIYRSYFKRKISSILTVLQYKFVQNSSNLITTYSLGNSSRRILKKYPADIYVIHAMYNFISIKDIKKLAKKSKKVVITLHDQRPFTGGCHYSFNCNNYASSCRACPQVRTIFRRKIQKQLRNQVSNLNRIDNLVVISPSLWLLEKSQESKCFQNKKSFVIKNPIPSNYLFGEPTKNDEIRILFVAAQLKNRNKGLATLLNALELLTEEFPERKLNLKLVGSGKININNANVKISQVELNNDDDMALIMQNSDFLVVPSILDNSPNVIGEALMCGLPVIGSDTGGISELLNMFGMPTFKTNNAIELADQINGKFWEVDRKSIAQKATDIFGYGKFAKTYSEVLKLM